MRVFKMFVLLSVFATSLVVNLPATDDQLAERIINMPNFSNGFGQRNSRIVTLVEMIERCPSIDRTEETMELALNAAPTILIVELAIELNSMQRCVNSGIQQHEESLSEYKNRIYTESDCDKIKSILVWIKSLDEELRDLKEVALLIEELRAKYCSSLGTL